MFSKRSLLALAALLAPATATVCNPGELAVVLDSQNLRRITANNCFSFSVGETTCGAYDEAAVTCNHNGTLIESIALQAVVSPDPDAQLNFSTCREQRSDPGDLCPGADLGSTVQTLFCCAP